MAKTKELPGIGHLTVHQRHNLAKLAKFLWELPVTYEHFTMKVFGTHRNPESETGYSADLIDRAAHRLDIRKDCVVTGCEGHACGAVGCAVGHGPDAGIKPKTRESWNQYAKRCFGVDSVDYHPGQPLWTWCFSEEWTGYDDTAKGAARRIVWALMFGVPDNFMPDENGFIRYDSELLDEESCNYEVHRASGLKLTARHWKKLGIL